MVVDGTVFFVRGRGTAEPLLRVNLDHKLMQRMIKKVLCIGLQSKKKTENDSSRLSLRFFFLCGARSDLDRQLCMQVVLATEPRHILRNFCQNTSLILSVSIHFHRHLLAFILMTGRRFLKYLVGQYNKHRTVYFHIQAVLYNSAAAVLAFAKNCEMFALSLPEHAP